MRIVPLVMVLALCLLGAAPLLAGDGDVMQHLGMLGEWAPNCRLPLGPTNGRVVLSLSPGGEVTTLRTATFGARRAIAASASAFFLASVSPSRAST